MKRTTVSLPDQLTDALDRYRDEQGMRQPVSSLIRAALQEYLARRGYESEPPFEAFIITPAASGSGFRDVSADHDRYLAETAAHE